MSMLKVLFLAMLGVAVLTVGSQGATAAPGGVGVGAPEFRGPVLDGAGRMCAGIAGIQCGPGETCDMGPGPVHPDQSGICRANRSCTRELRPVCGNDRHTYANACLARNAGAAVDHAGACRAAGYCPQIYRPVCSDKGRTFPNACLATNAGARIRHAGRC